MAGNTGLNTNGKQGWFSLLKKEFQKSPLASHLVFSLLLVLLEKLTDTEFECPCKYWFNVFFVATFFIIPGILASVLMSVIPERDPYNKMNSSNTSQSQAVKSDKCTKAKRWLKENARKILFFIFPAIVWMILLLMDGRYIACAKTKWSGRYVTADKAAPVKWCEPDKSTLYEERLKMSQGWYFHSQWFGMGSAGILAIIVWCTFYFTKPEEHQSSGGKDADDSSAHTRAEQSDESAV